MSEPIIVIDNLAIGYERALLRPLAFTINKGDFWGVVGPNGAGKSTLIKTIVGLIKPFSGKVSFPSGALRFGYVPQANAGGHHYPLSAFDVVAMGMYDRNYNVPFIAKNDKLKIISEMERLGLSGAIDRPFAALSGGQKQRALVARALASEPDVLILDEPTSGMDITGEFDMLEFLKALMRKKPDLSVIMVSHNLAKVLSYVGSVCIINKELDIFEAGTAEEMIKGDKLSSAYKREIRITGVDGGYFIGIKE